MSVADGGPCSGFCHAAFGLSVRQAPLDRLAFISPALSCSQKLKPRAESPQVRGATRPSKTLKEGAKKEEEKKMRMKIALCVSVN